MARCGCGGAGGAGGCACVVQGDGVNIGVAGTGSPENPYVVTFIGSLGGGTFVQVADTTTLDLSISGTGSIGNPYIVSGVVPAGTVVPQTEATQDIVGAMANTSLVYNDGANTLGVKISADANNALVFGADGGIYGLTDTSDFARLSVPNVFTAAQWVEGQDDRTIQHLTLSRWGPVPDPTADMMVVEYGTTSGARQNSFWCNEVGMPRCRTALGSANEVAFRVYNRAGYTGNMTSWVAQEEDQQKPSAYVDSVGRIWAKNTYESAWVAITINSPTVGGRYAAHAPGSGTDYAAPACRLTEGGNTLEFRGQIDVTGGTVADADVIASVLPTVTLGWLLAQPMNVARDQRVPVSITNPNGAGGVLKIHADGKLSAAFVGAGVTTISLDGIRVTRAA